MTTVVYRASENLATGQVPLFEVSGVVQIEGIVGRVSSAITANDTTEIMTFGPSWNLNGKAAGNLLGTTVSTDNVQPLMVGAPKVVDDGYQVKLWYQGTSPAGATEWALWYTPLTPGAEVTAV